MKELYQTDHMQEGMAKLADRRAERLRKMDLIVYAIPYEELAAKLRDGRARPV